MKFQSKAIIVTLILFFLLIVGVSIGNNQHFINIINTSNISVQNNNSIEDITPTAIVENNSFYIPTNDYIINNIDWLSYPNLRVGYVDQAQICEPNEIVPHKYIAVGVISEVNDGNNRTQIYEQLSGVALDLRRLCGPNSAICVFGTDHGVVAWTVTMRVYDDKVYY
jgi:hypothetical protein